MKKCFLLAIVGLLISVCGCEEPKKPDEVKKERIDNIVRVLMHKRGHYTFIVQEPGSTQMKLVTYYVGYNKEELFADVPDDQKMWAEFRSVYDYTYNRDDGYIKDKTLSIHIHSEKNIEGAGWQESHGKGGTEEGTTNVIK